MCMQVLCVSVVKCDFLPYLQTEAIHSKTIWSYYCLLSAISNLFSFHIACFIFCLCYGILGVNKNKLKLKC